MPRIHIDGGLYLITTRGVHGGQLYRDEADYAEYMGLLSRYKEQYKFKIYSYVLMPTYLHLFIELAPGTTTSEIMHVMSSTYTKYFNARHSRRGHLFEGRFKSILIEKSTHLAELTRYIHLLPVWGGVTNVPEDHKWSSYTVYTGAEKGLPGMRDDIREVLEHFSQEPQEQVHLYKGFTASATDTEMDSMRKKIHASWIIGSKTFIDNIKNRLAEDAKKKEAEEEKTWIQSPSNRLFLTYGLAVLLLLGVFAVYLHRINVGLVKEFESMRIKQEEEFMEQLSDVRDRVKRELEAKYKKSTE